jgi:hypothetical protein
MAGIRRSTEITSTQVVCPPITPILPTRQKPLPSPLARAAKVPRPFSDAGFMVQPSSSDLMLEFTLSSRASQLNGAVLNSESAPGVRSYGRVHPDPPHRNIKENYKFAITDQNGKFCITPGDYKLLSWDSRPILRTLRVRCRMAQAV